MMMGICVKRLSFVVMIGDVILFGKVEICIFLVVVVVIRNGKCLKD